MPRPQKITLGEMRASGVRGLLIYCSDYHCSHWTAIYVPTGLVVMALRNASGEAMVEMVSVPSPTP
jgi:hypothetical protein